MDNSKVLGIDCSTKKLSWTIVKDGGIEDYGEIYFSGTNFIDRYKDVRIKVMEEIEKGIFDGVTFVCFEEAVMVRNPSVALKLAGCFAVAISCLGELNCKMVQCAPMIWQNAIGNPPLRGKAKEKFLAGHSELKTKAKQQAFIRQYRKQVTINYVEKRSGIVMPNDDLGDSAGIAYYIYDKIGELNET